MASAMKCTIIHGLRVACIGMALDLHLKFRLIIPVPHSKSDDCPPPTPPSEGSSYPNRL